MEEGGVGGSVDLKIKCYLRFNHVARIALARLCDLRVGI